MLNLVTAESSLSSCICDIKIVSGAVEHFATLFLSCFRELVTIRPNDKVCSSKERNKGLVIVCITIVHVLHWNQLKDCN